MRVFTDFHHSSLLNSLILLFEKRLGGELFRPIGMDWYPDYWNVYPSIDTARQYLEPGAVPADGTPPLNDNLSSTITFENFKITKFDILIASIPQHIEPFLELIKLYQPQAKFIYQIGNQWDADPRLVKNVMASAKVNSLPGMNIVEYHQEFNLKTFWACGKCMITEYHVGWHNHRKPKIYSFINVLQEKPKDWELFLALEKLLPDFEFKAFGGQCRDGNMTGAEALADKMRECAFGFHCKTGGDGYGHIIHNLAATGTPFITRLEDYRGKLAEALITNDAVVLVDNKTPEQIADEIRAKYKDKAGVYDPMQRKVYQNFRDNVDFDAEEVLIREFLHKLS